MAKVKRKGVIARGDIEGIRYVISRRHFIHVEVTLKGVLRDIPLSYMVPGCPRGLTSVLVDEERILKYNYFHSVDGVPNYYSEKGVYRGGALGDRFSGNRIKWTRPDLITHTYAYVTRLVKLSHYIEELVRRHHANYEPIDTCSSKVLNPAGGGRWLGI